MGVITSRFRRKKTTTEILEGIETEIKSLEKDGIYKEQTRKKIIGQVMAYSVVFYLLFAMQYYYMYAGRSQHWLNFLLHASPLLLGPLVVLFIRFAISWYFDRKLSKNRAKLEKMKKEKKKILENVMDTETYKVAKGILDKYGNPAEQPIAIRPVSPLNVASSVSSTTTPKPASALQLRQRVQNSSAAILNNNQIMSVDSPMTLYSNMPRLRSDQLPRPLPDRNRSVMERLVDYLVKDGPNYRMALICRACYGHNGMALIELFDYTSFCCAYCGHLNPAKKQKPAAPPLTPLRALPPVPGHHFSGSDESPTRSSSSDSEPDDELDVKHAAEQEPERPPSPAEVETKSDEDKKED